MTWFSLLFLWLALSSGAPAIVLATDNPVARTKHDSIADLSKVWVLRERFVQEEQELVSVRPVPKYVLTFHADSTYRLIQENDLPNAVNGPEVVEEGVWELDGNKGYIGVRVTQVDGRAIRSALAYRWQIARILPSQLVLSTIASGAEVLVFEEKKLSAKRKL
ncbi:hypothetical protein FVR03_13075 [Pontibacter qinzhouensis]|uniref:Lipocalin-like domain-containing protein n=1 Tax=Pontibacter qinzhouensis TaxID=2603253 RepID=A0A5C8K5C2_9BACT|nr:hypothetical protein [Pontibacter qinzhouensis]TXK44883.1 hypothetical protein FVR03_13075 [Pontibacter qinzhouensis]